MKKNNTFYINIGSAHNELCGVPKRRRRDGGNDRSGEHHGRKYSRNKFSSADNRKNSRRSDAESIYRKSETQIGRRSAYHGDRHEQQRKRDNFNAPDI